MTESQTGPADRAGQPGGSGSPASGMPAGSGAGQPGEMTSGMGAGGAGTSMSDPGSTTAGSTTRRSGAISSGTATATQTSAAQSTAPQAAVPQQLGYQQERVAGEMDTGYDPGVAALSAAAKATWGAVLLGALGMVGLGICLLVWPHASLTVVAILIGAALIVSGFVRLYEGFTAKGESGGMRTAYVIIGLLAVVAGVYCVRHHALSLFLVAFVTGVYFIMHGIADIGVSFTPGVPNRALRGILGVVSLAAGILMIAWPGITLVLLLTLVAAWLIFYGLMLAVLSFSLRRAGKASESKSAPSQRLATSTG
jgi:uncharacterized membrane protein HdeD (DUF308 family)